MRAEQRDQVRDAARYLREVRPLDPEEIREYVEGSPHPAVVRRVLREEAVDLALVERANGTFVPVADGPISVAFDGVDRLPERFDRRLADLLVERFGVDWATGESGATLRATIARIKEDYYRQRAVEYDETVALAYAIYHLADYYATAQYVLDDLARDGLLGHHLRVLDVGAGVGGPALGLAEYLPDDVLVEYHAVEPSAAADVLDALLAETGPNVHPTIHRTTVESFDPDAVDGPDAFDLVCFANVLSELDDPAGVVDRSLDWLAPDGTAVLLAPADRNTSTGMRAVERELVDERGTATVYAPTVRLWPDERPTDRGWSFDAKPDVAAPAVQERLAESSEDPAAVRNTSVKFSHALLRTDGRRRHDVTLDESRVAKLRRADSFVSQRVDLVACKLSHDLSDGERPLFKLSDGSESVDVFAVVVRESALNEHLRRADYGSLVALENVLVLWNDEEGAINLVVDEETIVDPA